VTPKSDDDRRDEPEGWEAFEEEVSEGSLQPSEELEAALREAADAVEARHSTRGERGGRGGGGASGEEVAALRGELEALKDRYLRLQADFENHRRRTLKEREESARYGHENLVKDLLATVDNLDRAIDHARQSGGGDFQSMLQGVELVQRELLGALAKHGVEPIEAEGQPFDPNLHEAMGQEESDAVPPGTVVRELQKGYVLRDRLLRPTRVMVSKRASQEDT
jgi:molecular chaperone GrpE